MNMNTLKKSLLASAASLLLASTAHSAGVEIGLGYEDRVKSEDSAAYFIRPFTKVGNYTVGARLLSQRDTKSGNMLTFLEPQVGRTFGLTNDVSLTGTVGLGLMTAKSDSYVYGTADGRLNFKMTQDFAVSTGVRYRNDFESRIQFESLTYYAAASYNVLKDTAVTLAGYEKNLDERGTGFIVSVTQSF